MPSEDAAAWERYEALRRDLEQWAGFLSFREDQGEPDMVAEASAGVSQARAALDAFVRGLLTKPTQAEGGGGE